MDNEGRLGSPAPRLDTAVVHAGGFQVPNNAPSSPPLFQASSYEFESLEDVDAIYGGSRPGKIYGRYGGPNAAQFEAAMAELEGTEAALGTSAGMSAIDAALAVSVAPGEAIVVSQELYGGTALLFERDYRDRGFTVVPVDQQNPRDVENALLRHRPKVLYLEALTNPLMRVANLSALCALAREAKAVVIVDATFATPALLQPAAFGADLVAHSVGKYLGGHGDVGAGVVSGRAGLIARARDYAVRRGTTMAHFEAWLALRGLRTLALRVARQTSNAAALASYLTTQAHVAKVHHPSLPGHPEHELAGRLYPRGTGGIVSFDLRGGAAAAETFLSGLRMTAIVHSLGEIATTISYSAVSSHRFLDPATREAIGITPGTLRLSAGIEDPADIVADLARAFAGLGERVRA